MSKLAKQLGKSCFRMDQNLCDDYNMHKIPIKYNVNDTIEILDFAIYSKCKIALRKWKCFIQCTIINFHIGILRIVHRYC